MGLIDSIKSKLGMSGGSSSGSSGTSGASSQQSQQQQQSQAPPGGQKSSTHGGWSPGGGNSGSGTNKRYTSKNNQFTASVSAGKNYKNPKFTSRQKYTGHGSGNNVRTSGSQGPVGGKFHSRYQQQHTHKPGWIPTPPTPAVVHQSTIGQKVGTWAKEEKKYWKGEAVGAGKAVVSAVKQSPGTIKRAVDVGLANSFTFGSPKLRNYDKDGNRIGSQRLAAVRKRSIEMGQMYEQGRRDIVSQLRVKRTNRMVNEVIGYDTPAPMWDRGGRGKRSYTSTMKSRRQARSTMHRAKLQRRGGGGFQF
jgi:hypothetical protein